jgi:hypothetical protein
LNDDGLVTHVWCQICTKVMVKENSLRPSLFFYKHNSKKNAILIPMFNVTEGTSYYAKDCQHVINELFYVYGHGESALDRLCKVWHMRVWRKSFNLS